jgi:hypothetical protein
VEVIDFNAGDRRSIGSSADSDHDAYLAEFPLPAEERKYRKFLKE